MPLDTHRKKTGFGSQLSALTPSCSTGEILIPARGATVSVQCPRVTRNNPFHSPVNTPGPRS